MTREISYYANMALGVYRLLRSPYTGDIQRLRQNLEDREAHFLQSTARRVFGNPRNPYFEMFRMAGCTQGDLAGSVKSLGLEATLRRLASEGVYLTHDEFKGKAPLVRAGREIRFAPETLYNNVGRGYIESRSSGSRSRGTPTRKSLEQQLYPDVYDELRMREFDLTSRAIVTLFPILPSFVGLGNAIRGARRGHRVEQWFSMGGSVRDSTHYRTVTQFLVGMGRCMGAAIPRPSYLPANDFRPVAAWIAERKREGRPSVLRSYVSSGVRVAAAASEAGLDISGTLFLIGGEALTDAKRSAIAAVGCAAYPSYGISELGAVGVACRQMNQGNCVHLFTDALALVSRTRQAPLCDVEVSSLMFTTLLPFAPRFLINAEMDDSGVIGTATCGCQYSAAGLTTCVRQISSYGKLTGQGVTLLGSDVVNILETVLPHRFGGVAGDYQLVEREGERQTELVLRVSPRTGVTSTADIRDFFQVELRKCFGGALAARLWKHSAGLAVVLEEPCATHTGKVLPLHVLGLEALDVHAS